MPATCQAAGNHPLTTLPQSSHRRRGLQRIRRILLVVMWMATCLRFVRPSELLDQHPPRPQISTASTVLMLRHLSGASKLQLPSPNCPMAAPASFFLPGPCRPPLPTAPELGHGQRAEERMQVWMFPLLLHHHPRPLVVGHRPPTPASHCCVLEVEASSVPSAPAAPQPLQRREEVARTW